ncbi:succinate receptor 1-like [Clarias gariepinus]|uniref:succinate receptor 1-like n=1 Tax=Clarias gariepinus TaxID=13013 RepID=UPI00234E1F90|nr:succinate receptor 1-like [Clarias gariepinus]
MYALTFAFGFFGNMVVVLGYIFCLPVWRSTNVYLFNLAVSGLVFQCTLPQLSYSYAYNLQNVSPEICIINRSISYMNLYSTIIFMAWVSVDRYLLLCNPQREHILLTVKASLCIVITTWIWVTIQILPFIIFIIQDMEQTGWTKCHDISSLAEIKGSLIYSAVLTVTGYILPLMALYLSSQKMVSVLMKREEVLGTSFQRPVKLVRLSSVMFLVLYTPLHIMRNVRITSRLPELNVPECISDYIYAVYTVTRPIAYADTVINPVFYCLMTDNFKEAMLNKWSQLKRMLRTAT